jgi:hypothetical protein
MLLAKGNCVFGGTGDDRDGMINAHDTINAHEMMNAHCK